MVGLMAEASITFLRAGERRADPLRFVRFQNQMEEGIVACADVREAIAKIEVSTECPELKQIKFSP